MISQRPPAAVPGVRSQIYYWKCDRSATFHGTGTRPDLGPYEASLLQILTSLFPGAAIELRPAGGQGNHITWFAKIGDTAWFVRVEDGPERDDYIEVESRILTEVRALGVPAPKVVAADASRSQAPFAWQILERIDAPDLNHLLKTGTLDLLRVAREIGVNVARWQALCPEGYGPFDPQTLRTKNRLIGFHPRYADYFHLNLGRHLDFLVERSFLAPAEAAEILEEIRAHHALLELEGGCLVHKDLALWNILGTPTSIAAFIDWDDAIAGDPMDDLSLLGCFHDGPTLARVLDGYQSVRGLPDEHRRRFWMHLLRNMVVKAVIRVGAGYFERGQDFFLIGSGRSGRDLKAFTRSRLQAALEGLRADRGIETLQP